MLLFLKKRCIIIVDISERGIFVNKKNYQLELEKIIKSITGEKKPTLLLHACCAPCSSYVLEYLSEHFDIAVYFYNPNINTEKEFHFRHSELRRLISQMPLKNPVKLIETEYNADEFYSFVKGFEGEKEGGERCNKCFELRLYKTAEQAKAGGFDYFTTTLTISPLKNADTLNCIGEKAAAAYGVSFLPSDFKKKNGYKRSTELSKEFELYRQNFCGCAFSFSESQKRQQ